MRHEDRKFTISYYSEVSAEITLGRYDDTIKSDQIVARANHPSGTGMGNWFWFSDKEEKKEIQSGLEFGCSVDDYQNEREATLAVLKHMGDELYPGVTFRDDMTKEKFYHDLLLAFIVGELHVQQPVFGERFLDTTELQRVRTGP